eukprot:137902_1
MTTETSSFGINIKINEVEIITLETFCTASTIVSDLKKIISRERNIPNWDNIELKCNGNEMNNNHSLAVYDVICDKHLIYLTITDEEPLDIQIEGENKAMIEHKTTSTLDSATNNNALQTHSNQSNNNQLNNHNNQLNNHNKNETLENSTLIIISIFYLLAIISYCIGLYGYCTLRDEWNVYDISECDAIQDAISQVNLPIGGLSFAFAMSILFLCFFYCLKCDAEMEQGALGCGGLWIISLIMATVFSS